MRTHIYLSYLGRGKRDYLDYLFRIFFLLKGPLFGSTRKDETNWLPSWPNEQKESSTPVTWRHSRRQVQLVSR